MNKQTRRKADEYMQNRKDKYIRKYIDIGVCDERGAVFHATAVNLPGGEFGMCVLAVNGNVLTVYDTDSKKPVGAKMYTVPLKNAKDIMINDSFFSELIKGYSLKFIYDGATYKFKNAYSQKDALAVIRSEAK